ncbi:MAG: riboflavin biosynthesis protein RibF [Acidobacteriota bacterium]
MQVVNDAIHGSDLPRGGIATIGNFDGLHRGQRAIVDQVVARARELGESALAITFEPHPLSILRPAEAPTLLVTPAQKDRLFEAAGMDALLRVRFTPEFAETRAEDFITRFLHRKLALREIYVGKNFVFGRGREGTLELLESLGRKLGFTALGVDEVRAKGKPVSSTRIRNAVADGRVDEAWELLGRPYAVEGVIQRGDRMGKRLGWPTINVAADNKLLPADGVYACRVFFPSYPASFDCVTNIGTRPTIYENYQRVMEGHILDFGGNVYGERVELGFHKRLREERIFPSVMDLSAQIARDVDSTREYFAGRRRLEREQEAAPVGDQA